MPPVNVGWLAWRASSSSGDHVNGPELQTADCDINNDVDWPGHGADRVPMIHIWQNNLSIAMNSSGINAWKIILDEDGPICGITLVLPSLNPSRSDRIRNHEILFTQIIFPDWTIWFGACNRIQLWYFMASLQLQHYRFWKPHPPFELGHAQKLKFLLTCRLMIIN